jgi:hypothetical protein
MTSVERSALMKQRGTRDKVATTSSPCLACKSPYTSLIRVLKWWKRPVGTVGSCRCLKDEDYFGRHLQRT